MKRTMKLLSLVLALCMALSLGSFAFAADDVDAAYVDYIHEWLLAEMAVNSSLTEAQIEDEFMPLIEAKNYVDFPAEMLWSGMFTNGVAMTYDEFAAQYTPAGDASDEASGEALSAEEAYVDYIYEWLLAELEVNSSMTIEQIEDEFMPLIEAGNYVDFPADMLYSGMLNNGIAMTFEEFAAQYVPAASGSASGDTSEAAYQAYLKAYVDACPAVTDEQYAEFAACIDAGDYVSFPVEMCFTDAYWGYVAMTLDEFVAAGGVYEIPAFDSGLTAD